MRSLVLGLSLIGALAASPAFAEIGAADAVPASTLLLPYFEVDLLNPAGITTLLSINNASATAVVVHVTMWTDEAIPTLNFDIYLTGYDIQTINVRDIFSGNLPVTADAGSDPQNKISPKGPLSQDINFPGSTGPCGSPNTVYVNPAVNATLVNHIRAAHTGLFSTVLNGCGGANYGDGIARGYITADVVNSCNLSFPSDAGYFTVLATNQNVLWGDYFYVNPTRNLAEGDTLVHIESCSNPTVGNGAGQCPFSFPGGDYTFYGRYNAVAGQDQREPLATTFASRYINGGTFTGGTDLIVWRDTKTRPVGPNGPHACGAHPAWFPITQTDVVAFDEQETATDQCAASNCFPLATQRIKTAGPNVVAAPLTLASPFGWLYLNLNYPLSSGDPYPGRAQAWVTTIMSAEGRFSVGFKAIQLDNATSSSPNGIVLIP